MFFKNFIQEWEVAIRRRSFTWNPWKLFVKKLICNDVARCQPASLRKELFHTSSCILSAFTKNALRLLLPKRLWKCTNTISFRKYHREVVLLVICLINCDSSTQLSSCRIWNLTFSSVQFFSNKLELFLSCNNIKIKRISFLLLSVLMCTFL